MAGLCIVGERLLEGLLFGCCIFDALLTELCETLDALDVTLDLDDALELEAEEDED
jgi:hypothetical protein